MNTEANLNFEIVKIFIESYLVKNQKFVFKNDCIYSNSLELIFMLELNCLVLKRLSSNGFVAQTYH